MSERRFESRLDDCELAVVAWHENGATLQQLGNVENLSLNGAGLIVDFPVPVGTDVDMAYGEGELHAVVRHCKPLSEGHFIGVEFCGASRGFGK